MSQRWSPDEIEARWYAWARDEGADEARARRVAHAALTAINGGWDPLAAAQNALGPRAQPPRRGPGRLARLLRRGPR